MLQPVTCQAGAPVDRARRTSRWTVSAVSAQEPPKQRCNLTHDEAFDIDAALQLKLMLGIPAQLRSAVSTFSSCRTDRPPGQNHRKMTACVDERVPVDCWEIDCFCTAILENHVLISCVQARQLLVGFFFLPLLHVCVQAWGHHAFIPTFFKDL